MEAKKCRNCEKEVVQEKGKREKLFCSDNCRSAFYQKTKPKERKYVQIDKHNRIVSELQSRLTQLEAQISGQGVAKVDVPKNEETGGNDKKNNNTDDFKPQPMPYHEILQKIRIGADVSEIEAIVSVSKLTPPQRSMIQSKLK